MIISKCTKKEYWVYYLTCSKVNSPGNEAKFRSLWPSRPCCFIVHTQLCNKRSFSGHNNVKYIINICGEVYFLISHHSKTISPYKKMRRKESLYYIQNKLITENYGPQNIFQQNQILLVHYSTCSHFNTIIYSVH
jgi:hypothetical protein